MAARQGRLGHSDLTLEGKQKVGKAVFEYLKLKLFRIKDGNTTCGDKLLRLSGLEKTSQEFADKLADFPAFLEGIKPDEDSLMEWNTERPSILSLYTNGTI